MKSDGKKYTFRPTDKLVVGPIISLAFLGAVAHPLTAFAVLEFIRPRRLFIAALIANLFVMTAVQIESWIRGRLSGGGGATRAPAPVHGLLFPFRIIGALFLSGYRVRVRLRGNIGFIHCQALEVVTGNGRYLILHDGRSTSSRLVSARHLILTEFDISRDVVAQHEYDLAVQLAFLDEGVRVELQPHTHEAAVDRAILQHGFAMGSGRTDGRAEVFQQRLSDRELTTID